LAFLSRPGRDWRLGISHWGYDREADALYIPLLDEEFVCPIVRFTDDVALDFAAGEKLVGIEVPGASELFAKPDAPVVELKDLMSRVLSG